MKSKWETFHSNYSPIEINKPDTGKSNLQTDWFRKAGEENTFINGVPLGNYAKAYNNFVEENDVEQFFYNVILINMVSTTNEDKEKIVGHLKKAFHQGGYLNPVTSALSMSMNEEKNGKSLPYATIGNSDREETINIVTTGKGFKVQEFVKVKSLLIAADSYEHFQVNKFNPRLLPKEGYDFIIKAQGTIDLNFSKNPENPEVTVDSNSISYGDSKIKNKMDKRDFKQILEDFIYYLFGYNAVKHIGPEEKEPEAPTSNFSEELSVRMGK